MLTYILRRAALIVPTFFGVTLLAFALIHLIPGDPVENLSGERGMWGLFHLISIPFWIVAAAVGAWLV